MNKFALIILLGSCTACNVRTPTSPAAAAAPQWSATVLHAAWQGSVPVLPDNFAIEWNGTRLQFGTIVATITKQEQFRSISATTTDGASIQLTFTSTTEGQWAYTSDGGWATGTLALK